MLTFKNINSIGLLLLIILIISNLFFIKISIYLFVCLFLIWGIITIIGSFNITWNYHLNAINNNPLITDKEIAITFDDGPNKEYTLKVLDILKKHNAVATFFCVGKNIEQHPTIIKKIIAEGHLIGNHSYSHSNYFGFFNTKKVIAEIEKTNQLVKILTNKQVTYFRPPFGVTNPSISKALKHTKHLTFGWNIRSLDTVISNEQKIINRITNKVQPGSIILLHDSHHKIEVVLEQLLIFLQKNNYKTVSLEELSNTKAYA